MSVLGTDLIGRLLAAWVRLVLRVRKPVIVLGIAGGILSVVYASHHLGINTDTADMISPALAWRQDFIAYRDAFTVRDRNLLVVIDAPDAERAERFADQLAERLRMQPEVFPEVLVVGGGEFFERNGLLYLSMPQLEELADRLSAAQPLLGRLTRRLSGAAVLDLATEAAEHASGNSSAVPVDTLDAELARTLEAAASGARAPVSWRRLIAPEGEQTRRLLLIRPLLEFDRARPAERAMQGLRQAIETLQQRDGMVRARVTGSVAMAHEELESVTRGASLAGVAALAMVMGVLYLALRSVMLLSLSVVTLLLGLAVTAAFAAFAVGHLNLLSVAFAVLYVGLGVDFILHIGLRFKELAAEGLAIEDALVETLRGVGSTLAVCAITTAAGFYSFIPTPFQGVSELGLISGTGMFVSLFVSVTVFPALLAELYRGSSRRRERPWVGARVLAPLLSRPRAVLLVTGSVTIAALASLPAVRFDSNPIHLRDPGTESVTTLLDLAAHGQALPLNLIALAPDRETAGRWSRELAALPEVRAVETIDSLVPPDQPPKRAVLDDLELLLGPHFGEVERAAYDPASLEGSLAALDRGLGAAAERGPGQRRLAAAAQALVARLAADDAAARAARLRALDADLVERFPAMLERLARSLGAMPFTRTDLPTELRERWIGSQGQQLLEISPAEDTTDNAAAARFVSAVRAIAPHVTGLPVVNLEASRTVIESFRLAFIYALITVLAILLLTGLGLKDTLLVLGPVVLAAAVTGGAAVWFGLDFNFANIITLPLLLGIGVDNGIHIIHRSHQAAGQAVGVMASSTSQAVVASGITTVASFGNLAFSAHLGMASMGQLLTLGIVVTLAATLITLPAILLLMGRRM